MKLWGIWPGSWRNVPWVQRHCQMASFFGQPDSVPLRSPNQSGPPFLLLLVEFWVPQAGKSACGSPWGWVMIGSALLTLSVLLPNGKPDAMLCVFILSDPLDYSERGFINCISQVGRLRLIEAKWLSGGWHHTTWKGQKEEGSLFHH